MGVRATLATELSGALGYTEGELIAESGPLLTVRCDSPLVVPPREGMGVAVFVHLDEPVLLLGVLDGPPDANGVVRLRRVKQRG
ncbi:MAG: hypothetical protein WCP59_11285 [Actinomycetota bacterium]|jgi:hypothetical protein